MSPNSGTATKKTKVPMSIKVFISYRRDDTATFAAGQVYDRLKREFCVFMDVDAIPKGVNFVNEIKQAVAQCNVLLAILGQVG